MASEIEQIVGILPQIIFLIVFSACIAFYLAKLAYKIMDGILDWTAALIETEEVKKPKMTAIPAPQNHTW